MKILICAAGSGGHIYPALSLAQELAAVNPANKIIFLCSKKSLDQQIFRQHPQYQVVISDFIAPYREFSHSAANKTHNIRKMMSFCLKNFCFLLKFSKESIKVFILLVRLKPGIVIGFGGVGSVSPIIGARILNIPTLIHEQNVVPGLANKFLMRFATKIATGYKQTKDFFSPKLQNMFFTGNPIRSDLKKIAKNKARQCLDLQENLFTILVFGGSQGSEFINKCFLRALSLLSEDNCRKLQIIHITGIQHYEPVKLNYRNLNFCNSQLKIYGFSKDIELFYSAADLVICRAGAGTLNEISFLGKPAILIPYPYAQAHQIMNAKFMQQEKASIIIEQDDQACEKLNIELEQLLNDPVRLELMEKKCFQLYQADAVKNLVALVKDLV